MSGDSFSESNKESPSAAEYVNPKLQYNQNILTEAD